MSRTTTKPQSPCTTETLPLVSGQEFIGRINAAALIDCSPQVIDRWIRAGRFRAYHVGRKVVVRRAELVRLVEAGEC